jgi:hypothetical protein
MTHRTPWGTLFFRASTLENVFASQERLIIMLEKKHIYIRLENMIAKWENELKVLQKEDYDISFFHKGFIQGQLLQLTNCRKDLSELIKKN